MDKNNKVSYFFNTKWTFANSLPKLANVPALPYNYKLIVHDYDKLRRLKEGPIMDLTHTGIVNEHANDIITCPDIEIYIFLPA